ncbi:MAG: GDYXXLXY domain-containing protein [Oligoflexus sp.]
MKITPKIWAAMAVFLPIAALSFWLMDVHRSAQNSLRIRLPIEGFDPRDLLSGHYIRYQINYGSTELCQQEDAPDVETCVCLSQHGKWHEADWAGQCSLRPPNCELYIKGHCDHRFTAGIERYYIPEELSPWLQILPQDSNLDLAVDKSGRAIVRGIFVQTEDGEISLLDYAKSKQSED